MGWFPYYCEREGCNSGVLERHEVVYGDDFKRYCSEQCKSPPKDKGE